MRGELTHQHKSPLIFLGLLHSLISSLALKYLFCVSLFILDFFIEKQETKMTEL